MAAALIDHASVIQIPIGVMNRVEQGEVDDIVTAWMLPQEVIQTIWPQEGSRNIARCRLHRPPNCDCWSSQRPNGVSTRPSNPFPMNSALPSMRRPLPWRARWAAAIVKSQHNWSRSPSLSQPAEALRPFARQVPCKPVYHRHCRRRVSCHSDAGGINGITFRGNI